MWVDQRFQLNSNSLEKIIMRILVIDGQGGGIGRSLVELLVKNFPDAEVGATYEFHRYGNHAERRPVFCGHW